MLKEAYRVLKPRGTLIVISYGSPDRRLIHFQKRDDFDWEIRVEKILKMRQAPGDGETQTEEMAEPDYQYIYFCVKRGSDLPLGSANQSMLDETTSKVSNTLVK